jgi:hypothetical protein
MRTHCSPTVRALRAATVTLTCLAFARADTASVRLAFGQQTPARSTFSVRLLPGSTGLQMSSPRGVDFEATDQPANPARFEAGGGDVDVLEANVEWPSVTDRSGGPFPFQYNGDAMWKYLFEHGTPGQITRLRDDPALTPGAPVLTVQTREDGTRGFSIGLLQLRKHRALWLPEHDAYVTLADDPLPWADHLASLAGERTLDEVRVAPEATLASFTNRWEDMGNPNVWNRPWETSWLGTRGHLIPVVAQHGSLSKFGIDRWASVRPDHASPHRFRFDPLWPDSRWTAQHLTDGLPVIVTHLEREGQRARIEQFAAPLYPTPPDRRGEVASVLFTRVELSGEGPVRFGFRLATESTNRHPELRGSPGRYDVTDRETGAIWLRLEADNSFAVVTRAAAGQDRDPHLEFDCVGQLHPQQTNWIVLQLASPVVPPEEVHALDELAYYPRARAATVRYWEDWLEQGAQFAVPEPKVNELFRANLWHALRLPRFRTQDGVDRIDLPYSNFAYGQLNADWPINQAVYVDYMLHGLRGHFAVAEAEFAAMFQSQQRDNGRVGGYADWGVYTPSMLYAIGQNFLLPRDRAAFERLLPASLKALDWCLAELARAHASTTAPGLIVAPLNDLTHDAQAWAFPNAYFVAGLTVFGQALEAYGHPQADPCLAAARTLREEVEREFARGSVKAPVVPLADGTWHNYVPCAATLPRRLFEQWYPTDVDTGPLHLVRLAAIDPRGWLATALLHDHEDNLFLRQWGAANEPVYNPQGTAYLRRDEPEAAIRTFYSTMACAFSHGQLEPVEHRWAWGQYFGPPSTDGAWFELYRNLLLNELHGDGCLFVGQAIPRAWLADGQRITIRGAPTWFGPVNLDIESAAAQGSIMAQVEFTGPLRPTTLLVRLRHPTRQTLRAVLVNDAPWADFDPAREWIRLPTPEGPRYTIQARY